LSGGGEEARGTGGTRRRAGDGSGARSALHALAAANVRLVEAGRTHGARQ